MRIDYLAMKIGISLLLASSLLRADPPKDQRIDPAKIQDAMNFAKSNKDFAQSSAYNLDENAPPRGIDDADPKEVQEIAAMENDMVKSYNSEFLTNPVATTRFWSESPSRVFYDIATPGEYVGPEIQKFFAFIGPAFIGRLEYKEMKIYAKHGVGFVILKQNYYGKSLDGKPIHWIMRQTDGVVKQKGTWRILHSHISFPVDLATTIADLQSSKTPLPWDRPSAAPAVDLKK